MPSLCQAEPVPSLGRAQDDPGDSSETKPGRGQEVESRHLTRKQELTAWRIRRLKMVENEMFLYSEFV